MFELKKTFEISASHRLEGLSYESPCKYLHGHNFRITVHCRSVNLDKNGMVVDFSGIGKIVKGELDHKHLNDVWNLENPTSENIAKWICNRIARCYRVDVQEAEGNVVSYVEE